MTNPTSLLPLILGFFKPRPITGGDSVESSICARGAAAMVVGLPAGWTADYDGRRWFYTFGSTGHVQYSFPNEGD